MDAAVENLGECRFLSPLASRGGREFRFVINAEKIRYRVEIRPKNADEEDLFFEKAGPREYIYFDPPKVKAGIVTCGGLSPGLNNVIRSLVMTLNKVYGVTSILGFRYGFQGLKADSSTPPLVLTPESVFDIDHIGGSILGCSRGSVSDQEIVDTLERTGVNIFFCLGGDGTQRGSHAIAAEVKKRGLPISIVGVPKTIDNDVSYVFRTFGFATAIEKAAEVIQSAVVETRSYQNGIAIVKLMGRDAGFITAEATMAVPDVDFSLIPEVPFKLKGENGLLLLVEQRLKDHGTVVIVVSEGAGQEFFEGLPDQFDASGNRLQHDIGLLLKEKILGHLTAKGIKGSLKYFDPSYSIRAVPANISDALFCDELSRAAVHAAMAGKTDVLIGHWYNNLTLIPISMVVAKKKRISPRQELWQNVLEVTGQPQVIG